MVNKDVDLTREELEKLTEEVTDPETTQKFREILEEAENDNDKWVSSDEELQKIVDSVDEQAETMKSIDLEKLYNEYVKWLYQETDAVNVKGDYMFKISIHCGMTLLTGGLWFLGLVAYWLYQLKKDLDRRDADIYTEWEKKEK